VRDGDDVWKPIAEALADLVSALDPPRVFAPQGLGSHADHLQLILAVRDTLAEDLVCWYRDTPYAIREPDAVPSTLLPADLTEQAAPLSEDRLAAKIAGVCAYESQIGFQFGGPAEAARKLREFHQAEAARLGLTGYAEAYLTTA
jgi:LmbE family N-acetylglucosaminyl deacetylase